MAKLASNSPLSGASGRIGGLVTYMSNGIQIVRSLPERSKKHKLSILQQLHINSFKAQHAFAQSIKQSIIERVWSHLPIPAGMNPYNFFIKCNSDAFGKTEHVEFPQLMTLSSGKLLPVDNLTIGVANNKLYLSWTSKINFFNANANDKLTVAVLSDQKYLRIYKTKFIRSDEKAELELSELTDIAEGFIFWATPNDKVFSRSDYWRHIKGESSLIAYSI